ncbi:MAG: hypothetical protein BWX70_03407 [Verrucomicrobia bacterium ADurb.Bin070]|nr:MAG: hypothetical protein BWX70_03407 [Verrucomicrobia bacterium ADurb.Bin070]
MVELRIQVDRGTLNDFRAQMDRLVKELGKTPEDATRMGALALLKSLKTATKIAPERRKVRVDKTWRKKSRDASGNQRFLMRKFDRKTGAEHDVEIWAPSLAEAKQSKLTVMHYRGIGKASWGWAAQRLFPGQKVGYGGRKPHREAFSVTQRGKGNAYEIVVMNKLDYIGLALKGGESAAMSTAMRAATNTLFGRIEQRLKGKIK